MPPLSPPFSPPFTPNKFSTLFDIFLNTLNTSERWRGAFLGGKLKRQPHEKLLALAPAYPQRGTPGKDGRRTQTPQLPAFSYRVVDGPLRGARRAVR